MPPSNNTQNTNQQAGGRRKVKPLIFAVTLVVLLVAGGAYLKIYDNHQKHRYDYNYQGKSSSSVKVGGLSFSKPSQFSTTLRKTDSKYDIAAFTHADATNYPIGYLMAISYKNNLASDKKYIADVNAVLAKDINYPQRVEYLSAINHQVFDSYAKAGYSAQLSGEAKFTNANIKENAWSFDINTTNSNSGIKPMQGRLVYIIAPGNFYYLAVMTVKENWVSNQTTWQHMFDNLKVN